MTANSDNRRKLRVLLAERALGIPPMRRCVKCYGRVTSKTGLCRRCVPKRQKSAPCREKAIQLYRQGVTSIVIAKSCAISTERVCQFLRPTGLIGTIQRPKTPRQLAIQRHRFAKMRRRIMERYAVCKLYRSGFTVHRLRQLGFSNAQHVLKAANEPMRKHGPVPGRLQNQPLTRPAR